MKATRVFLLGGACFALLATSASAISVVATVNLQPLQATIMSINAVTHRVYIPGDDNAGASILSVVNGTTNTVETVIDIGVKATAIGVNEATNRIYVAGERRSDSALVLAVIDASTNTVVQDAPTGIDVAADLAVNPATNQVFVIGFDIENGYDPVIGVFDGDSGEKLRTVSIQGEGRGVVVNSQTNRVYVLTQQTVVPIDPEAGIAFDPITLPADSDNKLLGISAVTNRLFVSGYDEFGNRNLYVIDPDLGVLATVNTFTDPFSLAVSPATNRVYVTGPEVETNRRLLTVVDTEAAVVVTSEEIEGVDMSDLVVDPAAGRAYVLGFVPDLNGYGLAVVDITDESGDSTPPELFLPGPLSAEATSSAGAAVSFDVTAIDDVDGMLEVTCAPASGSTFPIGLTYVGCGAADSAGNSVLDSFPVRVSDNTAPSIVSVVPSQPTLWPPNHTLVPLTIAVSATDAVDPNPSCAIESVASNQPVTAGEVDWIIDGPQALRLRSERHGNVDRVYTIAVACRDARGNVSHANTAVAVSHN